MFLILPIPKNLGPMGLLSELLMSCFLAMDVLARPKCPRFGRFPPDPSPPPDPLRGTLPSAGPPNISLFFPFPATIIFAFFFLSLSLVGSWNFGGVLNRGDTQMCTLRLSGCRKCQEQIYNFLSPEKKVSNTTDIPRDDALPLPKPTLLGPTPSGPLFLVVLCAVCAAPDSTACCWFFGCFWAADRRTPFPFHLYSV